MTVRCAQCRKLKPKAETFQAKRYGRTPATRFQATICVGCADRVAGATNPYYGRWSVDSVIEARENYIHRTDLSEMVQKGLWK